MYGVHAAIPDVNHSGTVAQNLTWGECGRAQSVKGHSMRNVCLYPVTEYLRNLFIQIAFMFYDSVLLWFILILRFCHVVKILNMA